MATRKKPVPPYTGVELCTCCWRPDDHCDCEPCDSCGAFKDPKSSFHGGLGCCPADEALRKEKDSIGVSWSPPGL